MAARTVLLALTVLAGCAMRVTGTVRDRATGYPIGGAMLVANDGRGRLVYSGGNGEYDLKTDWGHATMAVTADGFRSTTVHVVPGKTRHPIVDVELDREPTAAPSAGQ
jgi:hypothetical protein